MNCYLYGILGVGMLMATFSTLTISDEQRDKFKEVLPPELDEIYDKISKERRDHYIHGLLLGLILSFAVAYYMKFDDSFQNITLFLTITLGTGVVYYSLMPKSDYMLNHLTTQEENKAWLSVYKTMKKRYILGFVLGALASIPFALTLC